MSTLILSLLLLLLIGAGMLVAKPIHEHFLDAKVEASPALLNLLATPQLASKQPLQVDTLARDQALKHPPCPKCPDMSQYIRLDEIPCWNCSVP